MARLTSKATWKRVARWLAGAAPRQTPDGRPLPDEYRTFKEGAWQSEQAARQYVVNTSAPTVGMAMEEDHAAAYAADWVLDVGAGTGRVSRRLAAAGHKVIAADLSASMLEAGRKLASHPYVCCRASGFDLPFTDGAFDAVISFWFLLHFRDWPRLLGEMARVLRPGGRLVVEVMNRPHLDAALRIDPRVPLAEQAGKKESFTVWVTPDEVRDALRPAGLGVRKVVPYDLFTENALAQATLGDGYRAWIDEMRTLLRDPDCFRFWRRFEQVELPRLTPALARRLIVVGEKGDVGISPLKDPPLPAEAARTPAVVRSVQLFTQAFQTVIPKASWPTVCRA
jgi:SAM-dependent methyltransferase